MYFTFKKAEGKAEPSFVTRMLAEEGETTTLESIRSCAGTVYFGISNSWLRIYLLI